ncbi:YdeI/OmpD-associated family protein [Rasiella sp. SM2506]|uniref:YdeI/OmpD-associated family protein n=1 Tax=Rasiella sp. SM2506 TaxID=3423914 RepID=UPI003D7A966B
MLRSNIFEVTIISTHGVIIPAKEAQPFLDKGHSRVALKAFFNNKEISFHGKLHRRNEEILVSFGKRYQKELGVTLSDFFKLQLEEDVTKYGVEMPEELDAVLKTDYEAFECFKKLTDGKKRSLIYYILRLKNTQTRVDRSLIICENLTMGITDLKQLVKYTR